MPHPTLGLPPADTTAGHPAAAARLRDSNGRLAKLALQATLRDTPGFNERYDEISLRLFLRDFERHVEQLARALETGHTSSLTTYAESIVPVYRRREVPMADVAALLAGLRTAAGTVLTPEERDAAAVMFDQWVAKLKFHQRLPGDHKGNSLIRFFWKGAGVGDDKWI
jgi:hypothetical protein